MSRRLAVLNQIESAWAGCERCELAATRTKVAFWRGNPEARLILIGEAPGEHEDKSGRPFTGPAGRLLDAALRSAGLDPAEDVWIANQLGCRPPANRKPTHDELRICRPRLFSMARAVGARAKFVLLLGATAGKLAGINTVQDWRREELEVTFLGDPEIVTKGSITTHPSFVLRTGGKGSDTYKELVKDIKHAYSLANQ